MSLPQIAPARTRSSTSPGASAAGEGAGTRTSVNVDGATSWAAHMSLNAGSLEKRPGGPAGPPGERLTLRPHGCDVVADDLDAVEQFGERPLAWCVRCRAQHFQQGLLVGDVGDDQPAPRPSSTGSRRCRRPAWPRSSPRPRRRSAVPAPDRPGRGGRRRGTSASATRPALSGAACRRTACRRPGAWRS